jgi:hypothetical protein
MISLLYYGIIAACVLILTVILFRRAGRLEKERVRDTSLSMEEYLFKIARVTGNSEYDVFCKSAEIWPVSREKIDQDFSNYLQHQNVPHYVNDFVRRNKKHIDELHLPRF